MKGCSWLIWKECVSRNSLANSAFSAFRPSIKALYIDANVLLALYIVDTQTKLPFIQQILFEMQSNFMGVAPVCLVMTIANSSKFWARSCQAKCLTLPTCSANIGSQYSLQRHCGYPRMGQGSLKRRQWDCWLYVASREPDVWPGSTTGRRGRKGSGVFSPGP